MKVLLLASERNAKRYSEFYVGLHKTIGSLDMRRLSDDDQANLRNYFAQNVTLGNYDRIVLQFNHHTLCNQVSFLKTLKNLVFLAKFINFSGAGTRGALANIVTSSFTTRNQVNLGDAAYLKVFKKMPWVRIIVSNYHALQHLESLGLDVKFVPDGYNTLKFRDQDLPRTIKLALVESSQIESTPERNAFIQTLKSQYPQLIIEKDDTTPQIASSTLPRTLVAVCADFGVGEYRSRVFEAMACGCLVMCSNQGDIENKPLSLRDGKNIVLFNSFDEFQYKLQLLMRQPQKMAEIAKAGQALAMEQHQYFDLGTQAAKYIAAPMRNPNDYDVGLSVFGWRF